MCNCKVISADERMGRQAGGAVRGKKPQSRKLSIEECREHSRKGENVGKKLLSLAEFIVPHTNVATYF